MGYSVASVGYKCWWGAVVKEKKNFFEFDRFDFLYSGALWGWPLPITYFLL